jgi:hypothetical protein
MSPDYSNMERMGGYMYYPTGGNGQNMGSNGNVNYYTEIPGLMGRDPR